LRNFGHNSLLSWLQRKNAKGNLRKKLNGFGKTKRKQQKQDEGIKKRNKRIKSNHELDK
jgi:hypothetical protein